VMGAVNPTPALFLSAARAVQISSYSSCTYCAFTERLRRYARLRSARSVRLRDATVVIKETRRKEMATESFDSSWMRGLTPPWGFFDEENTDTQQTPRNKLDGE
jgi:hypothetical protein